MSTRGALARLAGDGFRGVYHHQDSNPRQLGPTLYQAARQRGLGGLLRLLIDEHPAGWITIVDTNLDALVGAENGPRCFCHRAHADAPLPVTQAEDLGMEWAYVFDEPNSAMTILERVVEGRHMHGAFGHGVPGQQWTVRATIALAGPEPDWGRIEEGI